MAKITFAVKIDTRIAELLRNFCNTHGIKQNFFVEKALKEQIEKEELTEDLLDFKKHKSEEKNAISFEEYLRLKNV